MEHTKEPWRVCAGWPTAVVMGDDEGGFDLRNAPTPEANARRIVACVNACEGISTERLETFLGAAANKSVITLTTDNLGLKKQRDELLAVVEKLVAWNKTYPSSRVYGYGDIKQIAAEMDAINAEAEAAIAKVKGGAS